MMNRTLTEADLDAAELLAGELERQQNTLVLIPSENYASRAVLAMSGSVFTNKYAEGTPGKRYYNGCEFYDKMEALAIERAKTLFGADHANVQPHAGAMANMAAYFALLQPGDTVMGMRLDCGGHLTHGLPQNFSAKLYRFVAYGVHKETETLDYDEIRHLAHEHRPRLIVCGASAYPRVIDFARLHEIADEAGAYLMADIAHVAGLVVGDVHPDPVPHCDLVTTTTHKTLRGPRGALILCRAQHAKAVDAALFPGVQSGPLMHHVAAKAVAFHEAAQPEFRAYAAQIVRNAKAMAEELLARGFRLVSGGTDNHLMLVDLREGNTTGRDAADLLERAGICCNKNTVPFDERPPTVCSGIRLGTPAVTTRGMAEEEMRLIAKLIAQVLEAGDEEGLLTEVREQVRELCQQFPIYQHVTEDLALAR